uniref:Regulatory protein zeste n=1 Tax=Cacopsylla melanoneura TaxID=428564 RepID=A0A8D8QJX2_9HEMI
MEKRAFSLSETKVLLELIQKHKEKIENKSTDAMTSSEKKKAWEVLVIEYNSQGMSPRSSTTLQNKWKQLKKFSKKTVAAERRAYLQTGGGPAEKTPKFLPESLQQLVEGIMSSVSMKGNENSYDSNAGKI